MESLRDQDGFFHLEDVTGAIAGVIAAPPGIIEHNGIFRNTERKSHFAHHRGFIVVHETIVATHQQSFDLPGMEESGNGAAAAANGAVEDVVEAVEAIDES